MNDKLHTTATAVAGAVGVLLVLYGVALATLKLGDPAMAIEYGFAFIAGSGLIQMVPKSAGVAIGDAGDAAVAQVLAQNALIAQALYDMLTGDDQGAKTQVNALNPTLFRFL